MSDKFPQERRWVGWREGAPVEPRVVARCAFCSSEVSALLEQAREAFEQHVCDRPNVWRATPFR